MLAAGLTDIGRVRSQNQDAIYVSLEKTGPLPNLFIVADGMGGHNAGDVASKFAVESFCKLISESPAAASEESFLDLLITALHAANLAVYGKARSDAALGGMGTTFTACVVGNGKAEFAHVGDSRAYLITGGKISQVTTDHTYVNEMVKAGQLTLSQAREHPKRNILTRVLGVDSEMQADGYVSDVSGGGLILLCSDGLTNMLKEDELLRICGGDGAVEEKLRAMIDKANENGGGDNISAVLIDLNH
jgi:protein phosphatase